MNAHLKISILSVCIFSFFSPLNSAANENDKNKKEKEDIDELIISGEKTASTTDIRPDTELLLNVAGAGFDPLAAILSLPGVTFASDYSSEPAVRGSAPDDNGYYVDFIPARYVFHIFGHSIFNHNLIHSFDLYPAAFSSQYSNATGAIIDVALRDPKQQPFTTTIDASFIGTGALIESRITDNQAFYMSYRRSLIDLFIQDEEDIEDEDSGVDIDQIPISDDYQMKYTWDVNARHRLTALATGASDEVAATFQESSNLALTDPDFTGAASVDTSFDSQGLAWNWNSKTNRHNSKLILTHTSDADDISYGTGQFLDVTTDRLMVRGHYDLQLGNKHTLTFGGSVEETEYNLQLNAKIPPCTSLDTYCPTIDVPLLTFKTEFDVKTSIAYLEDQWQIADSFYLRSGIHYLTDDYLNHSDAEPRIRLEYEPSENWQLYLAYGHYSQLPQPEEISPNIGSQNLEYIQSTHSVFGLKQYFGNEWSWQVDLYYKELDKLPLANAVSRYTNDASGLAYGMEVLINKKLTDSFYGWLAVSLSHTERKNDLTNETSEFAYDKPVIINLVGNYKLTENIIFGIKWSIQSGSLYTPIIDTSPNINDPTILEPVYGELNSERHSIYHRLDLRAEYTKTTSFGFMSTFIDVLNAYNAKNIQGYSYAPNGNNTIGSTPDGYGSNVPVTRSEGLGFFPSIGFKIQF
ncbi:MAG: hypothetical protein K6L75_01960 [Cellvibrionaceae bacterium]